MVNKITILSYDAMYGNKTDGTVKKRINLSHRTNTNQIRTLSPAPGRQTQYPFHHYLQEDRDVPWLVRGIL